MYLKFVIIRAVDSRCAVKNPQLGCVANGKNREETWLRSKICRMSDTDG